MEDSELCLQAANELGKETPVRFKIHLVSQITLIPTNQKKMLGKPKLTNGCPWNVPWAQSC